MYERFYQFRERPFALSPDPDYLYPSRVHQAALDYLRYGIEGHAGFVVITGEIGSGKTTLLQALLRNLDNRTTVARLMNTLLEPRELLEAILVDLGAETVPPSKPLLVRDLARVLLQQRAQGRRVVLVIDEAQNLPLPSLEEVRMLSNLETEKSKLIQIVLVGQPELRETLARPELRQLRQRITVSYHIQPLDAVETAAYINHRLRRAALGVPLEFPIAVTDLVHARSRGVPRMINVICDAALFFGYAEGCRVIDARLLEEVFQELEATQVLKAPQVERRPAPRPEARPAPPPPRTGDASFARREPSPPPAAPDPRRGPPGSAALPRHAAAAPRPPAVALPAAAAPPHAGTARRYPPAGRPALASAAVASPGETVAPFGRLIWSSDPAWQPAEPVTFWQRVRRLFGL